MNTTRTYAFLCVILISSFSCRSIKETQTLKNCSYSFLSISNVRVNNVSIDNKQSLRDLQTTETLKISQAIMARKIPVDLTAHISVHNPNLRTATLHKINWKLLLKDKEVADGVVIESYSIKPNETIEIPIAISSDIGSVLKIFSVKELMNMLFNLSSASIPEEAQLKIKPSIAIGRKTIQSPAYFTVNISK
ncbi:MAG: hypothetical protein ACOCWB_05280 [Bacteroidota bacterium]